ncbi:MAG: hypothetical protein HRF45_10260 [Fimbriimonadia bacterium]|jgi:prepilin-type processing-associated H-X9-DG protein
MKRVLVAAAVLAAAALWLSAMQDQEQARESACQHNHNQAIKAMIMYANDNDAFLAIADQAGIGNPEWGTLPETGQGTTWVASIMPYSKSLDIFFCPSDPTAGKREALERDPRTDEALPEKAGKHLRLSATLYRTNLGYNHVWLCPEAMLGDRRVVMPTTQSKVAAPAMTVLFIDTAWSRDASGKPTGGGRYLADAPIRPHIGVFWGPLPAKKEGLGGWLCYTMGGGEESSTYCRSHPQAYGYCYPFHPGQTFTVSYLDGHVQSRTRQQLMAGVSAADQKISNAQECHWDTVE